MHLKKDKKGYYRLYEHGHYAKYIGNAGALEKFKATLERERRLCEALTENPGISSETKSIETVLNRASTPPMPEGLFNVVYADPPWQYDNTGVDGAAEHHYETMPTEDICRLIKILPIDKEAVLFLWATNPFLEDALKVVNRWGFEYKTNMVWVKTNLKKPGAGFYVRGRHELLFICTKGSFTPDLAGKPPIGSVLEAPVNEHSRKPADVYTLIEKLYPDGHGLELFAREKHSDYWTPWGNEL